MFHLFAYDDTITNTANDQITALNDQIVAIVNSNFQFNQDVYIPAFMVLGSGVNTARLSSPTLRQITQPQLYPIHPTLVPTTDPNYVDYLTRPLQVRGGEELQLQVTGSSTANTHVTGLGWALTSVDPVPAKDQITIIGTSTTACVANTWTDVVVTWTDQIPSGVYTAISSRHVAANAQAHRWIFDNEYWRPGYSSDSAFGSRQPLFMPPAVMGTMGQFRNTSMPRLQVLSNSTDNSHTVFLKIARTGN